jgi:RNA polymerase sigma factor (sigma-70 family)
MSGDAVNPMLRCIRQLALKGEFRLMTDGQLLERFVRHRDEAAFEVLVHRHGPMIWRVCRQLLGNSQDCEDACQATFLVLIRKAGSIGRRELLGNWLYGVALRVAGRVRKTAWRRQTTQRAGAEFLAEPARQVAGRPDWLRDLHEVLGGLPAKYRQPLVLCYLEGQTNEEAAQKLKWPVGTLKVRLMRGREMLRLRLERRGLAVSTAALSAALAAEADAALPAGLAPARLLASLEFIACAPAGAGVPSSHTLSLARGVIHSMRWTKMKTTVVLLLALASFGTGIGWVLLGSTAAHPVSPPQAPSKQSAQAARPIPKNGPLGMKFVRLPRGTFYMGWNGRRGSARKANIKEDFEVGVYTVTQEQWQKLMGTNPSHFSRQGEEKDKVKDIKDVDLKRFPVENVSWNDVQEFIKKLNKKEKGKGYGYRLPTEAEWEYACRGGATTQEECSYHFYFARPTNDLSSTQANFHGGLPDGKGEKGPNLERPTKVGSYAPNKLGLYDMHGNVSQLTDNLDGSRRRAYRVIRGGSWLTDGCYCEAADRSSVAPTYRSYDTGFRLARVRVR